MKLDFAWHFFKAENANLPDSTVFEMIINWVKPQFCAELKRARPTKLAEAYERFRRAERIIDPENSGSINLVTNQTMPTDVGMQRMLFIYQRD